jgi:hypothetical protein
MSFQATFLVDGMFLQVENFQPRDPQTAYVDQDGNVVDKTPDWIKENTPVVYYIGGVVTDQSTTLPQKYLVSLLSELKKDQLMFVVSTLGPLTDIDRGLVIQVLQG